MKHDKIIMHMTLKEKLELITSEKFFETRTPENYSVPVIKAKNKFANINGGISYDNMKSTFNMELLDKLASFSARAFQNEHEIYVPILEFFNKSDVNSNNYLDYEIAKHYGNGIKKSGYIVCLNEASYSNDKKLRMSELLYFIDAVKKASPDMVFVTSKDALLELKNIEYKGLITYKPETKEDFIAGLNSGVLVSYVDFDIIEPITEALELYKVKYNEYKNEYFSKAEYEELFRTGQIIMPSTINYAVDNLLSFIGKFDVMTRKSLENNYDVIYDAALESTIMLKNEFALPVDYESVNIVTGSFAFKSYGGGPKLADQIEGYTIKCKKITENLDTAIDNTESDNQVLLFMDVTNKKYNPDDLEKLNHLANETKNIVVILNALPDDLTPVMSLAKAVLVSSKSPLSYKALLDVLTGRKSPRGRLPYEVSNLPLGYGLSYAKCEIDKFDSDKHGITFKVSNNSQDEGSILAILYITYPKGRKEIADFKKETVEREGDARIYLAYNDMSFKSYFLDKKAYGILAGDYTITVTVNGVTAYEEEIVLSELVTKYNPENIITEAGDGNNLTTEFRNTEFKDSFYTARRGMSFKKKMGIGIPLVLYFNIALILVNLMLIIPNNLIVPMIIIFTLVALLDIGFVIFALVSKNLSKKKVISDTEKQMEGTQEFEKLMGDLKAYNENYHESFVVKEEEPDTTVEEMIASLEEPKEEEIAEEEALEEEVVEETQEEPEEEIEEVKLRNYSELDFIADSKNTVFTEKIYLDEYVTTFTEYTLSRGLIIDPSSSRLLFAALASNKIIFMKKNSDLITELLAVLAEYLGSQQYLMDIAGRPLDEDLVWTLEGDTYYESNMIRAMVDAYTNRNNITFAVLENADMEYMNQNFDDVLRYAKTPHERHLLRIRDSVEEVKLEFTENFYTFVIPQDKNYLEAITPAFLDSAIFLDIDVRRNTIESSFEKEIKYLSYDAFKRLIASEAENVYMDEESFKRIDDFEEKLASEAPFKIGNKIMLSVEDLTTALLLSGADQGEILDYTLSTKIIPITKMYVPYLNNDSTNPVLEAMEKCFDTEIIEHALKTARKPE